MEERTTKRFSHLAPSFENLAEDVAVTVVVDVKAWLAEVDWHLCGTHGIYAKGGCPVCEGESKPSHRKIRDLLEDYDRFEEYKDFFNSTKLLVEELVSEG